MARTILHLDLDAFFCAVEELHNPALAGRAFAVGGRPESRGVVASCSYPARRKGVRSAMPTAQALRLCPELVVVPPRHRAYSALSRKVMDRLYRLTAVVEQISIDEAFLDVSALNRPGERLARELQATIRRELGLPCSLGVASNKLVAKIANNVGKTAGRGDGPPNAITVVPPGQEAAFLAPLPCAELWGVGPKTAARLAELGIATIGDLAQRSSEEMDALFGKQGRDLVLRARGLDDRPVATEHERKSVSQETTFGRDVRDGGVLRATLRELAEGVSRDLRCEGLAGATVRLKLRRPDFSTPTRQMRLEQATDDAARIYAAALRLFEQLWIEGEPVRLLGVGVSGMATGPRQMELFAPRDPRAERIDATLEAVRRRFGEGALVRANRLAPPRRPGMDDSSFQD